MSAVLHMQTDLFIYLFIYFALMVMYWLDFVDMVHQIYKKSQVSIKRIWQKFGVRLRSFRNSNKESSFRLDRHNASSKEESVPLSAEWFIFFFVINAIKG